MVFQQFNLWPHMTALGNVTEALRRVKKMKRTEAEAIGMAQLTRVAWLRNRMPIPAACRAASSSAWRSPEHSRCSRK